MTTAVAASPSLDKLPVPDFEFNWQQLARELLTAKGISKGWWRVGMKLHFGAITAQMGAPGQVQVPMPTALVGIDSVAIYATTQGGDLVFDAGKNFAPVPAGAVAPADSRQAPRKKVVLRRR
jgi:hypothetical protein